MDGYRVHAGQSALRLCTKYGAKTLVSMLGAYKRIVAILVGALLSILLLQYRGLYTRTSAPISRPTKAESLEQPAAGLSDDVAKIDVGARIKRIEQSLSLIRNDTRSSKHHNLRDVENKLRSIEESLQFIRTQQTHLNFQRPLPTEKFINIADSYKNLIVDKQLTDENHSGATNKEGEHKSGARISDRSSSNATAIKHILLVAYMRGGSTLLGELFNQNQHVLYWFEPVAGMYLSYFGAQSHPLDFFYHSNNTLRALAEEEETAIFDTLDDMFACEADKLPTGVLASPYFGFGKMKALNSYAACILGETEPPEKLRPFNGAHRPFETNVDRNAPSVLRCNRMRVPFCPAHIYRNVSVSTKCFHEIAALRQQKLDVKHQNFKSSRSHYLEAAEQCFRRARLSYLRCQDLMKEPCEQATTVAVKSIRLRLSTAVKYMRSRPHVKVIYLIRDPRGIVYSRANLRYLSPISNGSIEHESYLLCKKMMDDLEQYEKWKDSDQLLLLKYEDLAVYPLEKLQKIYRHVGLDLEQNVIDWLMTSTHAQWDDKKLLGTQRINSRETASSWKRKLTPHQIKSITSACTQVLDKAQYLY